MLTQEERRKRKAAYMSDYYAKFPEKQERHRALNRERNRRLRSDPEYLIQEKIRRALRDMERDNG